MTRRWRRNVKHSQISEMEEEENIVRVPVPGALPLLLATHSLPINVNGLCLRCARLCSSSSQATRSLSLAFGVHVCAPPLSGIHLRLSLAFSLTPSRPSSAVYWSRACTDRTCGRPSKKVYRRAQVKIT